jgi:ectoine hydroxylase-related dioxygenase (phytanoyl-CoA dioxygenase family)
VTGRVLNPEGLAATRFVPFADSTELLADPEALQRRRAGDGYVFVRDVVPQEIVGPIFDGAAEVLERWGAAARDGRELRWSGRELPSYDPLPLYELPALEELIAADALAPVSERLYGRPVWVGKNVIFFFALPDDPAYITPPHRDAFGRAWFGEGDYCTLWVPLAPIAFADGGLALQPGTHRDPIPEYGDERNDELPEYRGRRQEGRVPRQARRAAVGPGTGNRGPKINAGHGLRLTIRDDEWLTGAFEPGDALFFSADMIHCGLPLKSDTVRLSIAARVYPGEGERPHQIPLGERLRRERAQISATAQ